MTQPGRITLQTAARALDVPTDFYLTLAHRRIVPPADGERTVDARALNRCRVKNRWLGMLGEPMSEREVRRYTGKDIPLPQHNVSNIAGVNVAPLWRYLQEEWTPVA